MANEVKMGSGAKPRTLAEWREAINSLAAAEEVCAVLYQSVGLGNHAKLSEAVALGFTWAAELAEEIPESEPNTEAVGELVKAAEAVLVGWADQRGSSPDMDRLRAAVAKAREPSDGQSK